MPRPASARPRTKTKNFCEAYAKYHEAEAEGLSTKLKYALL